MVNIAIIHGIMVSMDLFNTIQIQICIYIHGEHQTVINNMSSNMIIVDIVDRMHIARFLHLNHLRSRSRLMIVIMMVLSNYNTGFTNRNTLMIYQRCLDPVQVSIYDLPIILSLYFLSLTQPYFDKSVPDNGDRNSSNVDRSEINL